MMKFFSKKTPAKKPQAAQAAPPAISSSGDMAANLTVDILRPEARSLLQDLTDRLKGKTPAHSNNADSNNASIEHGSDAASFSNPLDGSFDPSKPPSEGMQSLLNTLSQKLFPHRHNGDDTAVDARALLDSLREKLQAAPPPSIHDQMAEQAKMAEQADLDPTAQTILERSMEAEEKLDVKAPLSGDTKAERATPEALANPFSLVNINRGAASAIPISPGIDKTTEDMTPKKKGKRAQRTERATVSYKKKLMQTRFSRRRFLRDYSGTTILSVIFLFILLLGVSVGTVVGNVMVLIPETRINQDAGKQSEAFRNEIARNEPKLAQILQRRQNIDAKVEDALDEFVTTKQIRDEFTALIEELDDDPRVEVSGQQIEAIENELPNVQAISVSFNVKTTFLLWLKYRIQMIRTYDDINVIQETIEAPPGVPTVNISITMSRPGRKAS